MNYIKTEIITNEAIIVDFKEMEGLWELDVFTNEQRKRFEKLIMKYKDVDSFEIINK